MHLNPDHKPVRRCKAIGSGPHRRTGEATIDSILLLTLKIFLFPSEKRKVWLFFFSLPGGVVCGKSAGPRIPPRCQVPGSTSLGDLHARAKFNAQVSQLCGGRCKLTRRAEGRQHAAAEVAAKWLRQRRGAGGRGTARAAASAEWREDTECARRGGTAGRAGSLNAGAGCRGRSRCTGDRGGGFYAAG